MSNNCASLCHTVWKLSWSWSFSGRAVPTYISPDPIKTVVREVIGGELRDYPDPEGPAVSINSFLKFTSHYFAFCMYPKTKTNVNIHPPFQCSASPEQNILKKFPFTSQKLYTRDPKRGKGGGE